MHAVVEQMVLICVGDFRIYKRLCGGHDENQESGLKGEQWRASRCSCVSLLAYCACIQYLDRSIVRDLAIKSGWIASYISSALPGCTHTINKDPQM